MLVGALLPCGCEEHPKDVPASIFLRPPACGNLLKGLEAEAERNRDGFRVDTIYTVFYSSKQKSCMVAKVIMQDDISVDTAEIDNLRSHFTVWSKHYAEANRGPQENRDLDEQIAALQ